MALPINIKSLISTETVENERKEFKEGWNPEKIIHSICAFANDINNWGGGYIIIGVAENNGSPILPPKGINISQIDKIQKEIIEVCNKLRPRYFPVVEPTVFDNANIVILWCPGGDHRPYSSPTSFGKKAQRASYVRRGSSSVKANEEEIRQLNELTAKIPFDDRMNHNASLDDLSFLLIREHLKEVGSDLYDELPKLNIKEIGLNMQIIKGSQEYFRPTNIGLLMFSENPQKYFRSSYIDIIIYKDKSGTEYEEKTFKGPIHHQLKSALKFITDNVIRRAIKKTKNKAKSEHNYNYPFLAIREALVNAVYHRSYEHDNQIEVHVRLDAIEMVSYPGALPPINNKTLKKKTITARNYRNRRIGDFLHELKLSERRGTGFTKIYTEMQKNNSPTPIFEMDDDKTFFLVKLKINSEFFKINQEIEILKYCVNPRTRKEILIEKLGLSYQTKNFDKHIAPLIEIGYLDFTIPKKPTSIKQKYKTTKKGLTVVNRN